MRIADCTFRFATLLLIGAAIMLLNACNTVEGVGQDVSAMGQSLADVAADTNPSKK